MSNRTKRKSHLELKRDADLLALGNSYRTRPLNQRDYQRDIEIEFILEHESQDPDKYWSSWAGKTAMTSVLLALGGVA